MVRPFRRSLVKAGISSKQIKYTIYDLVKQGILDKSGEGRATEYVQGKQMEEGQKLFARALELGLEEMKTRGELSKD